MKVFKIYNLAIKCIEFIYIFNNENFKLFTIIIDTLKYGYQIGFGTLVVHTLKYEYFSFSKNYKLTQNILLGEYNRKIET